VSSPHIFPMGRVVMTRNFKDKAEEAVGPAETADRIAQMIRRHGTGDWGELSAEDVTANAEALKDGDRLMSSYTDVFDFKVWVITEADRSVTTILLPSDY